MENLINVSPGLFIWSVVVFGIVFFILSKFAFPAISNALDEREKNINDGSLNTSLYAWRL